jgi:hypothetical protein
MHVAKRSMRKPDISSKQKAELKYHHRFIEMDKNIFNKRAFQKKQISLETDLCELKEKYEDCKTKLKSLEKVGFKSLKIRS